MLDNILEIREWKTPATDYPRKTVGSARIVQSFYERGYYHNYNVNGYTYIKVNKKIPITSLEIRDDNDKWNTWMVDDPPHFWSMKKYAENSIGKVLVAGLGLGLVTGELLYNKYVYTTTVLEINDSVIDLITPLLPSHRESQLKVVNDDFYKFVDETEEDFNRIIVDLWVTSSLEETLSVLQKEVIPLNIHLKEIFPNASIVYHGFGRM